MEPAIGRSLREGFKASTRSWAGMIVYGGCWVLLSFLVGLMMGLTRIPEELYLQPTATEEATAPEPATAPDSEPPSSPAPATTPENTTAPTAPASAGTPDLFGQMAGTKPAAPQAPGMDREPHAPAAARRVTAEEQAQIALEWLGGAWPVVLLSTVALVGVGLWLQGGQVGYLAAIVKGAAEPMLSAFWRAAAQAFLPLLGASGLSVAAVGGVVVVGMLGGMLLAALSSVAPGWLPTLLGLALLLTLLGALGWVGIRLLFWAIAIVTERMGPIAALRATFRLTQGRWWHTAGLALVLGLMAFATQLTAGFVGAFVAGAGHAAGGPAGIVLGFLGNVVTAVANVYIGFVLLAATIRFYEDAKASSASAAAKPA